MADLKWIKLSVNLFTDDKMKMIRTMPHGQQGQLLWVALLCLAGRCGATGQLMMTEGVPLSEKAISKTVDFTPEAVKKWLKVFQRLHMVDFEDGFWYIVNWEKHQSVDKIESIREYNKEAQRRSRERRKKANLSAERVIDNIIDMSLTCQPCQGTDIDIEKDKEEDIDISISEKEKEPRAGGGPPTEAGTATVRGNCPPTHIQVEKYAEEIGKTMNIDRFINYYEATGWRLGQRPIVDWRPLVRSWTEFDGNGVTSPSAGPRKSAAVPQGTDTYCPSFAVETANEIALRASYGDELYDEIFGTRGT